MAIEAEELVRGPLERDPHESPEAQRVGALYGAVPGLDDVFEQAEGDLPLRDLEAKAQATEAPKAEPQQPQAAPQGADQPQPEQGARGLGTLVIPQGMTPEVQQAIEAVAALPREQYEQFVARNPQHPLAQLSQAAASRMIRDWQRKNETRQQEQAQQQEDARRYQEYRQALKDAAQTEDYDLREKARDRLVGDLLDIAQQEEAMANPVIQERLTAAQEEAGRMALEYYTESVRQHPAFKDLDTAVFDQARSTAQSPGDYVQHVVNALIERRGLVPRSEMDAVVAARVKDQQAKGYNQIRSWDTAPTQGVPQYAQQIDWSKPADELFSIAFEGPQAPRAVTN